MEGVPIEEFGCGSRQAGPAAVEGHAALPTQTLTSPTDLLAQDSNDAVTRTIRNAIATYALSSPACHIGGQPHA
jgi:hypothetical protein